MPILAEPQPFEPFVVNTTIEDEQSGPAITFLASGDYVVLWADHSERSDPAIGTELRGQMFNRLGEPIGDEFAVNSTVPGYQDGVEVAGLAGGGFVATWGAEASGTYQVYAQIFDSAGSRVGSEFLVSTDIPGNKFTPDVTALPSGGFVITWFQGVLKAQLFDEDGGRIGGMFNVDGGGNASRPNIATLTSGEFVVAWQESFLDGANADGQGIAAQRFSAAGERLGPELLVNTVTDGDQVINGVAALDDGGFVVVWTDPNGADNIKAQLFDAAGVKVGGEILVNTTIFRFQNNAEVSALPGYGFVVTWTDSSGAHGDHDDVRGQVFANDGTRLGGEFLVNAPVAGLQGHAVVAGDGNGNFVVAWPDSQGGETGNDFDILARPYTISGELNRDTQQGGPGDDRYIVNHPDDVVIEAAGGGTDIVFSTVSYKLSETQELENLSTIQWQATDAINLTGNALANTLIGNAGINRLDGAAGNDIMFGREGNDIYFVDSALDRPIEYAGEGTDIVYASVSYTLATTTDVENLATRDWAATDPINLTGNHLANYMIGNDGKNQLDGRAGADVMVGRAGDDKYIVDNAGDKVFEAAGGGYDVVFTSVSVALTSDQEIEGLSSLDWNAATALTLTGNSLNNYLIGNAGANLLDGRAGNDTLQGREGADTYAFTTALGATNVDVILGFSAADDTIALENNGVFTGLAAGALPGSAFVIGTAAQDSNDRIVYDQATGRLFFDADGSGGVAQIQFARLDGAPIIAANDFTVI